MAKKFKLKLDDRVLISVPRDSIGAKYNGHVGRVTGFVQDWFVMVNVNGQALRFRPDDLKILS